MPRKQCYTIQASPPPLLQEPSTEPSCQLHTASEVPSPSHPWLSVHSTSGRVPGLSWHLQYCHVSHSGSSVLENKISKFHHPKWEKNKKSTTAYYIIFLKDEYSVISIYQYRANFTYLRNARQGTWETPYGYGTYGKDALYQSAGPWEQSCWSPCRAHKKVTILLTHDVILWVFSWYAYATMQL